MTKQEKPATSFSKQVKVVHTKGMFDKGRFGEVKFDEGTDFTKQTKPATTFTKQVKP